MDKTIIGNFNNAGTNTFITHQIREYDNEKTRCGLNVQDLRGDWQDVDIDSPSCKKCAHLSMWERLVFARERDDVVFHDSHENATESVGTDWYFVNRTVVESLSRAGYSPENPRTRAIVSLVVRTILDKNFCPPNFSLDLDFPYSRPYAQK